MSDLSDQAILRKIAALEAKIVRRAGQVTQGEGSAGWEWMLGLDSTRGYDSEKAAHVAGISTRTLDYWTRTQLIETKIGVGVSQTRLYGYREVVSLKVAQRLVDLGISLQQVRAAVAALRELGNREFFGTTVMSDGVDVYVAHSNDEVIDLVARGDGVFGLSVAKVAAEVRADLLGANAQPFASIEADNTEARDERRSAG